ncbi:ABC transporter permease [Oceanobacillus alkalisoli]|uniref:ABC transporter permease n=1 Tax=Oceanobacillus alkalisoli TaxID=2925113 RepID=UPI001EF11B75|nr:ABC transporter permease [Oceanobacillus alkalisoli]MCF3944339.1 ABC transporter permease [Oceanobacillus alkalisoli]MCG5104866.1 ABC transporter permease [Oceanobacillus alkalisoli]
MTGWKLFKLRFMDDIRYQRKILGMVIDWTIWFYAFIPFLIFGVLFYIDIWKDTASYWPEILPGTVIIRFLLLIVTIVQFRMFMQEADQLFLLDRLKLYRGLRRAAFSYSMLQKIGMSVLLLAIALPWLTQLIGLGVRQSFFIFTFLVAYQLLVATIKKVIRHPVKRWILIAVLFILSGNLLTYLTLDILFVASAALAIILIAWNYTVTVPAKRYFFEEVNDEIKERMRYAKMILGTAKEVEKPPIRFGKRPLILRNGRRIFKQPNPESGLLELLIKGLLRHTVYLKSYFQVVGITLFAIALLPIVWLKWLVFLLFILFLNYNSWLKGLYMKMLDEYFFHVIPIEKPAREAVWLRFRRLLMIPAIILAGLAAVLMTFVTIN